VPHYVKRRGLPVPGTIPDALGMFQAEVRFYREIAPVAGVRVPACYQADETGDGTVLVLEDLSVWRPGADPVMAATVRVTDAERAAAAAGPRTLVHGDASLLNMRTSPDGEVALVDWEDVSAVPGVADLAWLLTSSVDPARWDEVIAAYGPAGELSRVLPAAVVQGLLSLADTTAGSAAAMDWISRLGAAATTM
jgi:hypothetical protein